MLGTQPFGFAGRVQRIAEKNQPSKVAGAGRSNLRGDSPAHRFAADGQMTATEPRLIANAGDHRLVASLQPAVRIGDAAPLLAVKKIEGDNVDSARRQRSG